MIRINLLPHREMRREKRKKDFLGLSGAFAAAGAATALMVGIGINSMIDAQNQRNEYIVAKNAELDLQIKEIASLEAEIRSLKARQQSVESLQSDRTIPVHLFDELVKYVPDGVYLTVMKQTDKRVSLVGQAQTNERIAEFLRNLAATSEWLERPDLNEIKAIDIKGQGRNPSETRRLFEFTMNALLKTPSTLNADGKSVAKAPGSPVSLRVSNATGSQ